MKLVLFDCDGTLVDSQHVIVEAMRRAFAGAGLLAPPREEVLGIVGLSLAEAMRRLGGDAPDFPAEDLAERYRTAFRTMRTEPGFHEPLYPGIAEAIETLAAREDVLIGMATGKSQRGARAVLAHHGLTHRFVTIQTADDAPSKPHPEMVLRALAETGVAAQDTVLIGDTSFDMVMARAAQVRAVGVAWGYHSPELLVESGAERLVAGADELPAVCETLWLEFAHG